VSQFLQFQGIGREVPGIFVMVVTDIIGVCSMGVDIPAKVAVIDTSDALFQG